MKTQWENFKQFIEDRALPMIILGSVGAFVAFVLVVAQISVNEVLKNQNSSKERQIVLLSTLEKQNKELRELEAENRSLNLKMDCMIALHVQNPNGLVSPEELKECRIAADDSQRAVDGIINRPQSSSNSRTAGSSNSGNNGGGGTTEEPPGLARVCVGGVPGITPPNCVNLRADQ